MTAGQALFIGGGISDAYTTKFISGRKAFLLRILVFLGNFLGDVFGPVGLRVFS